MLVLNGRAKALDARYELATFTAWQGERFAREKELEPVQRYLEELKPKPPQQSTDEMLAALRAIKASQAGAH